MSDTVGIADGAPLYFVAFEGFKSFEPPLARSLIN
jgi:hypothetical protein